MEEKSVFSRIIDREIPADIIYENDSVVSFKDIAPQASVHVLVVPKKPFRDIMEADSDTIADVINGCKDVVKLLGLTESGFRLVINTGEGGGQTVFHLHAHILANPD
jgi:histidine triad (HIT) family protein